MEFYCTADFFIYKEDQINWGFQCRSHLLDTV